MEVCRLLKIMVLQLWVSVKIILHWAQIFDVSYARAKFSHDDTETGQSYRFLYSKRFDDTDTSLLVGYRYTEAIPQ